MLVSMKVDRKRITACLRNTHTEQCTTTANFNKKWRLGQVPGRLCIQLHFGFECVNITFVIPTRGDAALCSSPGSVLSPSGDSQPDWFLEGQLMKAWCLPHFGSAHT